MSIRNAVSFSEIVRRDAILIEREKMPEWFCDVETVFSARVLYGKKSGWTFSDSEYRAVIEKHIEQQLSKVPISRKGRFFILYEEFERGFTEFVESSIGAKVEDGQLIEGNSIANYSSAGNGRRNHCSRK